MTSAALWSLDGKKSLYHNDRKQTSSLLLQVTKREPDGQHESTMEAGTAAARGGLMGDTSPHWEMFHHQIALSQYPPVLLSLMKSAGERDIGHLQAEQLTRN
jgi:hypothetical protein